MARRELIRIKIHASLNRVKRMANTIDTAFSDDWISTCVQSGYHYKETDDIWFLRPSYGTLGVVGLVSPPWLFLLSFFFFGAAPIAPFFPCVSAVVGVATPLGVPTADGATLGG